jgi:Methyltransferase domain
MKQIVRLLLALATGISIGSLIRNLPRVDPKTRSKLESYGFFKYNNVDWARKIALHSWQSNRQKIGTHGSTGAIYFQENWEPTWSCEYDQRIGNQGDGGKWICDAYKLADTKRCIVLSVGSNNDFSFEIAIHELYPNCEIHTFDHTIVPRGVPPFVNFHATGLGPVDILDKNITTLKSALAAAGLSDAPIEVLKIDCEGCEYSVYPQFFTSFIRQILIEIHYNGGTQTEAMFEEMRDNGYVIHHKESNTIGCGGNCIEYGFIRIQL